MEEDKDAEGDDRLRHRHPCKEERHRGGERSVAAVGGMRWEAMMNRPLRNHSDDVDEEKRRRGDRWGGIAVINKEQGAGTMTTGRMGAADNEGSNGGSPGMMTAPPWTMMTIILKIKALSYKMSSRSRPSRLHWPLPIKTLSLG